MNCCRSGVNQGGGEGTCDKPEMGAREKGKDEGAIVEKAGKEGVRSLGKSVEAA